MAQISGLLAQKHLDHPRLVHSFDSYIQGSSPVNKLSWQKVISKEPNPVSCFEDGPPGLSHETSDHLRKLLDPH